MLMPFALGILEKVDEINPTRKAHCAMFGTAVMLGIAYGATCGGMATTIGTTPNLVLVSVMESYFGKNHTLNFTSYFVINIVPSLTMMAVAFCVITLKWSLGIQLEVPAEILDDMIARLPPFDRDQQATLLVQLAQVCLWFSREGGWGWGRFMIDNGKFWNDGGVAVLAAFPLFMVPSVQRRGERLLEARMLPEINWSVILLLGAGFAIANGVSLSGLSEFLAKGIHAAQEGVPLPLFLGLLVILVSSFTEFASNTATANILLPVLAVSAVNSNYHPLALMLPAVAACSCAFCFPMATPPNAVVFASRRVSFIEMVTTGLFINLTAVFVIPFVFLSYSFPVGGIGGFDGCPCPEWAKDALDHKPGELVNCTFTSPAPTPNL